MIKVLEDDVLRLKPSLFIFFGWYLATIGGFFIHPILGGVIGFITLVKVIILSCISYTIYDDRIIERRGVLNVTEETIPSFRIKSVKVTKPLWLRFFEVSNVHIISSEAYKPEMKLYAIEQSGLISSLLTDMAKTGRIRNKIRDIDLFY